MSQLLLITKQDISYFYQGQHFGSFLCKMPDGQEAWQCKNIEIVSIGDNKLYIIELQCKFSSKSLFFSMHS